MFAYWSHHALEGMQAIQSAGWLGWLIFIGLYALCCIFSIPASALILGAGAVYGFWGGVTLVVAGNGLGSLLTFLLSRYFLRDWAAGIVDQHPKLRAVKRAVEKDGWKFVFLTRLSPIMPFTLLNYALGLTNIPLLLFLVANASGALPSFFIYL